MTQTAIFNFGQLFPKVWDFAPTAESAEFQGNQAQSGEYPVYPEFSISNCLDANTALSLTRAIGVSTRNTVKFAYGHSIRD